MLGNQLHALRGTLKSKTLLVIYGVMILFLIRFFGVIAVAGH